MNCKQSFEKARNLQASFKVEFQMLIQLIPRIYSLRQMNSVLPLIETSYGLLSEASDYGLRKPLPKKLFSSSGGGTLLCLLFSVMGRSFYEYEAYI